MFQYIHFTFLTRNNTPSLKIVLFNCCISSNQLQCSIVKDDRKNKETII